MTAKNLISEVEKKVRLHIEALKLEIQEKIDQMKKGDEFSPGIIKIVKVLIAVNRKISVGDKMAGRHGNKGVVAKILPVEDMPFLGKTAARGCCAQPSGRSFAHERRPGL